MFITFNSEMVILAISLYGNIQHSLKPFTVISIFTYFYSKTSDCFLVDDTINIVNVYVVIES